jgi:hypothetical protein
MRRVTDLDTTVKRKDKRSTGFQMVEIGPDQDNTDRRKDKVKENIL